MTYRYIIIQENTVNRTKLTYEFTANDENEMTDEFNTFMDRIGFAQSGYLTFVNDIDQEFDDIDSEVNEYEEYKNPEMETYKNFEFPLDRNYYDTNMYEEGKGQTEYTFVSDDADSIAEKSNQLTSSWPFPLDRPSEQTFRVDSIYETNANVSYYGV